MRRKKVAWIFVGMNLAFWLGGCSTQEPGVAINEEQTPLFEEGAMTQEAAPGTQPVATASLRSFDRSNWETYHYISARGLVPHHPHYFTREFFWDGPLNADRPSPLKRDGQVEAMAGASTDGSREPLGWRRFFDVPQELADVGGDLIALPVRATFVQQPWDVVYSPGD